MFEVTALKLASKKMDQINVYLDNNYAFTVEAVVVNKLGLRVGQELSDRQIEEIKEINLVEKGIEAALQYLSYRPRSEKEVRQRLSKRGFNDVIGKVMERLREQGLVDDVAFAQFWKDNRMSFRPRSKRLLRQELVQKGVAEEVVTEVTASIDDEVSAVTAGRKKARLLANIDYPEFRRRLTNYLKLRGFGYETINSAITYLWQEIQSEKSV